ncbi:MAG TPA: PDZ domain-containing protein [Bacteroidota bacterium]|nr:PDZ domain-containing protein [Bacteroidota bacterium]
MAQSQPRIEYRLGMSRPSTHLFEIEMTLENLPQNEQSLEVVLPVWRSGRYVVFDFAGGVDEFWATDASGKSLPWRKTDKTTWRIDLQKSNTVRIQYKMFANEFHLRTKGLNDEHAFVDPMSVFMYVEKFRSLPLTLIISPYKNWHVTTGLEAVKGEKNTFTAPNYDYFADCPLEIGDHKDFEFEAEGKKHVIAIAGEGPYDPEVLKKDFAKIVKQHKEFWGDLPYDRYVFMIHLTTQGSGATEHINSTILLTRPTTFASAETYKRFLSTVAHEFFHTWNVKQLRPKGISPYDYTKENYTEELWIAEGITSYYPALFLVHGGFRSVSWYIESLGANIRDHRMRPGNTRQSLSEASFDAWVKHWRGNPQAYNFETDYYDKGSDVGLLLDLEIRSSSGNKSSLDDVMRMMYRRFPLGKGGYTVHDFQKAAEEAAGKSLQQFFNDYVHGTRPLEWEQYLGYAGLEVVEFQQQNSVWLGIGTTETAGTTRINRVIAGSPAYEAGLDINDELIAIDGMRVKHSDWADRVNLYKPGTKIRVSVFRADRLREFEVTLQEEKVPYYSVQRVKNPTDLQKSIFESWLKTKWEN